MADKWRFPIDRRIAIVAAMGWSTIVIFVAGVVNFALNRAVFDSGHPLLARLPRASRKLGQRASLVTEFAVLFFALLLSVNGWPGFVWAYLAYSLFNGVAAWLILGGKI
ncbi:hypothetical protein OIK40_03410 [Erythrobacter sp. sf7]|uniref:Uncharacterized protein n=1 Tax=Erythrobacter fulvus TaxID=2987523 RepID=A0ABT5JNB6_9SPHN|nr:hypothetical protein [Erythrobacter fulvus]MDC8753685.1 hypothetical protein [Erythrobacter fulvus]